MAREEHLDVLGLYTDPNPHTAPNGALRQAKNTVIRRKGVIEPRPGFKEAVSGWTPTANNTSRALIPFQRDVLVRSAGGALRYNWLSDGTQFSTSSPVDSTGHDPYAEMRGSLYVGTADDVQKATSATATAVDAGINRARQGYVAANTEGTTAQRFLADGDYVGYRIVYRREDANGYIIRSAPSGRMYLENATGAVANARLALPLHDSDGLAAGDVVEVYRTPTSSLAEPGEEFQLAVEHELTAANITANTVAVYDFTPNSALGASLYTNPGQLGELQANDRPPFVAKDIAEFRGSMFYANTSQRGRKVLRLADPERWGYHHGGSSDENNTGDVNGTTTLSNVTGGHVEGDDTGALREGMLVMEDGQTIGSDGTYIAWPTYVSSVDAVDQITLSTAALGTTTGLRLHFCDTIDLDGTKFHATASLDAANNSFKGIMHAGLTAVITPREMALNLCFVLNINTTVGDDWVVSLLSSGEDECELLFERVVDDSSADVTISNGEAWTPNPLGTGNTAGAVYSVGGETIPGRLYWSRTGLPEAVPPLNYVDVGDREKAIRRIIPTRDALWVLKDDGVWRLTGQGADVGWRVDPISSARLVAPRAAARFGEMGVAWFDQGVHLLAGSLIPVSEDIAKELDDRAAQILSASSPPAGAFVRTNLVDREVYVGVPANASVNYAERVWVLNLATKAWTTWEEDVRDLVMGTDGLLYRAESDGLAFGVGVERRNESVMCADKEYTITLGDTGNADAPWEDTSGSAWTPAVGDQVSYSVGETTITSFVTYVEGGTEFALAGGGTGSAGSATAYEAFTSTIEWLAKSGKAPTALKRWMDGAFVWESLYPAYQYDVGFKSDSARSTDADETEVVSDWGDPDSGSSTTPTVFEGSPARFFVPRAYSLSAILRPRLTITQAGVCWALAGLSIGFDYVSSRHRRQYG